jgi:hypothetical protein
MARQSRATRDIEAIRAVAKTIQSVDEVDPYVKVGIFGPNGSGKTRFGASAPKCLILDINEEGTRSAVGSGAKRVPVHSWETIGHVYWLLKGLLERGKCPYQSVSLDTVTMMYKLAMSFVLEESEDRDPTKEKSTPTKRDYGRAGELVNGMLLAYRNLDMHVIFLAQVRTITDDDTGALLEYAVNLPAGARGTFMDSVGILGFMERKVAKQRNPKTKKVERKIVTVTRTQPTEMEGEFPFLKDRTNNLAPFERELTMPKVIKAWANRQED